MSDFSQSADEIVIALNNQFLPPKLFSDKRLSFDVPQPAAGEDYDTTVIAHAIPGMGYYGDATVRYNRISLAMIGDQTTIVLQSEEQFTLQSICDQINGDREAFLDVVDLEPVTPPTLNPGDTVVITITASASSLGWKDSTTVTLSYGKPQLNAAIRNKSLLVLKSQMATDGSVNAKALLYNTDFTSYRDAIRPVQRPYGATFYWGYGNYAALLGVCRQIGVPGFPDANVFAQVQDYATSQIADSNPSFDRVVVGQVASGPLAPGPIYFHYNNLDTR